MRDCSVNCSIVADEMADKMSVLVEILIGQQLGGWGFSCDKIGSPLLLRFPNGNMIKVDVLCNRIRHPS